MKMIKISLVILLTVILGLNAATVTNLSVEFNKGQVSITFDEISGSGIQYQIYRETEAITDLSGKTPVAVIPQNSGLNRYTNERFIIEDNGSPLAAGVGLLVYTTDVDGDYYYAVTNSTDNTLVPGVNSLQQAVAENYFKYPRIVQMKPTWDNGSLGFVTEYFAWENYSRWNHDYGYYGHRFNVISIHEPAVSDTAYPLTLILHGAGTSGYVEPSVNAGGVPNGVFILPRCIQYKYDVDPYTFSKRYYSIWFGHPKDGIAYNYAEKRCKRYIKLIGADPKFAIDTNRVYVTGGSMGGGGSMHMAYHHPDVFAAAAPSIGWVDPATWAVGNHENEYGPASEAMPVDGTNGVSWWDWQDMKWLINQTPDVLPPIIHTFRKDDPIVSPVNYPAVLMATEAKKYCYYSEWKNGGHNQFFYTSGNVGYYRFRLDEAYPAFADASNSISFTSQEGQRNFDLDWSSSLHDLETGSTDDAIVDMENLFQMTFKSLSSSDATADITIRNAQNFICNANDNVSWTNLNLSSGDAIFSGTVTADANGLATIGDCEILTAGNTLVLTKEASTTASLPASPNDAFQITAFPNPFTTSVEISLVPRASYVVRREEIEITIFDINGKLVDRINPRCTEYEVQSTRTKWRALGQPNGIYMIRVKSGDRIMAKKTVLNR